MRRAWRRRPTRGEQGMSVVELTVVMVILGVVLSTLYGVVNVYTGTESRNQAFLQNQENVRLVLDRIGRDVRGSAQINDLSANRNGTSGSYSHQYAGKTVADAPYLVEFDKLDGTTWRWRLDTASNTLYEEKWNSGSSSFTSQFSLTNVRNYQTGVALFRYYRAGDGIELTPTSTSGMSDLANCAIHIHVSVASDSIPGPIPFTAESDVELRNRLSGGIPQC